ncbi:UDP-N-acetylmuramoyl-tripeptide--D-alanyl-D-alanine ligase [Desulfonatronospira sp.]|uniref:UDP-N-acetylmuramoyl-tripeptide--D-alanyl-D- alanine ligase n=1 Tax=Desulfonatronospira sp. TaxID=1962951 RepID=UPI0025B9982E|nr:UDP-N-acetylmuramoyl-tripeptide--D-alanyl-D-alanine ligase [Desulfonatronospira sp.]
MEMKLGEAARAMQGQADLKGLERAPVSAVKTDSRRTGPGDLFFCLQGTRNDGHSFARQAADRGALAIVAHRELSTVQDTPVLMVDDTLKALGRLGRHWRLKAGPKVLGITGSAGKTTTKEILAEVLKTRFKVGKNFQNWNNQLGLPLSLLMQRGNEDFWIMELGINNHTDMDELGEILHPDAALILNVGPCHLEGLGDVAGVARAKSCILDHLRAERRAFINLDYPDIKREAESRPDLNITWFSSCDPEAACRVSHSRDNWFILHLNGRDIFFEAPVQGAHFCENLAAIWAVALAYGMHTEEIRAGLKKVTLPEQRMSICRLGKWTIIDDSYNANPMSMQAALKTARSLASGENLILVLGDMAELGQAETRAHRDLGRSLCTEAFTALFYRGENLEHVLSGMNGTGSRKTHEIQDVSSFLSAWDKLGCPGGVIIFKGSRRAGMENFVQAFKASLKKDREAGR